MKKRLRILVVDDNRSSAVALAKLLQKRGDDATALHDGASAIAFIQASPPDVVLTDLKMEPVDGMAVLQAARGVRPPVETIVFTAYGAVDVAVQAMHMGARDFLTKPVSVEQVAARLDGLREDAGGAAPSSTLETFVAQSPPSVLLRETLERVAGVPSPVWLEGEMGSGRGFAARWLHRFGDLQAGKETPFTVIDPLRNEAWPTEGTVVLPNVDDLPLEVQQHLVRGLSSLPPKVRVIATAHGQGRRLVAEGKVRSDLYYRLAVIVVSVPALRQRAEDVLPLFEAALERYASLYGRPLPALEPEQLRALERSRWEGNVRELINMAERVVVMGVAGLQVSAGEPLDVKLPVLEPGFSLAKHLEGVERSLLVEALRVCDGDRNRAGKVLGVERNTLRYKLNKYGLLGK